MRNRTKRHNAAGAVIALLLAMALAVTAFGDTPSWGGMAAEITAAQKAQAGLAADAPLLAESGLLPAGSSLSDWTALAMARTGIEDDYADYLARLRDYVETKYREDGGLHRVKATEYHRIALTVAALGGDPTAFGTKEDGTAIDLIADGTYYWQGDAALGAQGLNGWIFALLTVDAVGAELPADARYSREEMLRQIVGAQLPDGGFSLGGGGSMDVDITAMAVQALAPYQQTCSEVIDRALQALSAAQLPGGGYASHDAENVESCAQVILALCALDIDPLADQRFQKAEGGVVDALLTFRQPDGSFAHQHDGGSDAMAGEQVMQALCAMERQQQGAEGIFDLRNVPPVAVEEAASGQSAVPAVALAAVFAAALALCVILWRKRRKRA